MRCVVIFSLFRRCRSCSCGVHLGSPTFSRKPSSSSQAGTAQQLLQTVTQARFSRSSSFCTIGPIVLAKCFHHSLPLHSRPNNPFQLRGAHATQLWRVKQTFLSCDGHTFFSKRLVWAFALPFRVSWPPVVPLLRDEARVVPRPLLRLEPIFWQLVSLRTAEDEQLHQVKRMIRGSAQHVVLDLF